MKTAQLQIRVSPEQKILLKSRAEHLGLSLSAYVLSRLLVVAPQGYPELLSALASGGQERFALAELNDLLSAISGSELTTSLTPPQPGLSARLENQVAAMIEHAASLKGVAAPAWCASIPPLPTPWFASELESLRAHLLSVSPVAFRRRNLFVDASVGDRV